LSVRDIATEIVSTSSESEGGKGHPRHPYTYTSRSWQKHTGKKMWVVDSGNPQSLQAMEPDQFLQ
jgi:hypothetical protein